MAFTKIELLFKIEVKHDLLQLSSEIIFDMTESPVSRLLVMSWNNDIMRDISLKLTNSQTGTFKQELFPCYSDLKIINAHAC